MQIYQKDSVFTTVTVTQDSTASGTRIRNVSHMISTAKALTHDMNVMPISDMLYTVNS